MFLLTTLCFSVSDDDDDDDDDDNNNEKKNAQRDANTSRWLQ